jgi:predicted site-specific integrase-resolvase
VTENDEKELSSRQRRLIALLLSKTVVEACREAKVGRVTAYRWLKDGGFKKALQQAQDDVFNEAMGLIKVNVSDAVNVVVGLMRAAEKEDSRIRAAQIVIEHARWLKTSEDLQRRIELLEQAVSSLR